MPEVIPFTFGEDPVNQGDYAQISCNVRRGDIPLAITWSLKGDIVSSDAVMSTTMIGQKTSILIIESVNYQHSGTYTCRAENLAGVTTFSANLLVNGNLCHSTGNIEITLRIGTRSTRKYIIWL